MADDTNKGNFYTSLDALANDFVEYADADVRAKYRDRPLEYFKEFHDFKLPPILEWIFNKMYNAAKETVDGGERSNGLDVIMCAARGGGKSLFASILEFSFWYFLDADCVDMAGSEDQALIVYNYVCSYIDADVYVGKAVDKRTMSMTTKKGQSPTPELRCVTSSPKSVAANTEVYTSGGIKEIKDVIIGDCVLVSDGTYSRVLNTFVSAPRGRWLKVDVRGDCDPLVLTDDHKVLTQRGWVEAKDLTTTDYTITPVPKNERFIPKFDLYASKHQNGDRNGKLAEVDFHHPDFYRLVGYYIAEGHSCGAGGHRGYKTKHRRIGFTVSTKTDQHLIKDIIELSNRFLCTNPSVYNNLNKNDSKRRVVVNAAPFQHFFAQFGDNAKRKIIPMDWLGLDDACLAQILFGMWEGDGHVPKVIDGKSLRSPYYSTSSKGLACWVKLALTRFGVTCNVKRYITKPTALVKKECVSYRVVVDIVSLHEFVKWVLGMPPEEIKQTYGDPKSSNNRWGVMREIKNLSLRSGIGAIDVIDPMEHYDIEVEEKREFCTTNGVVHNSVRGKHPGARRKAPGLLVIDEAAEVPDGLMKQALPMTKEARPPFNLMVSTFHHAFGDFQDFWDNAEARGFLKISMDSFDVCEKCVDDCTKCIPEFDETYCQLVCGCYFNFETRRDELPVWVRYHYQERLDETRLDQKPENCVYPKLCSECPHRETCGAIKVKIKLFGDLGRVCEKCGEKVDHKARRGDGHFPVEEVRKAWRRNDKVTFEVEYMGWRPGRGIFVLDPYEVDKAIVPDEQCYYKQGYGSTFLGIDWGAAGTTAMAVAQYMTDEFVNIVSYHSLNAPSDTDCYQLIADLSKQYNISMVLPDSSHVFQNMHIQKELGLPVNPINFTVQKEAGVGAMRMKFERRQVRIPERYKQTLCKDLKNWRRDVNGNIIKKNDHGPDALLCAMINSSSFGSAVTYFSEDEEKNRKNYYDRWDQSIF